MKITDVRIVTLLTGHEMISGLFDNGKTEKWFFVEPYFRDVFFVDDNAYWEDGWNDDEWLKSHNCRLAGKTTAVAIKKALCKEGLLDAWKIY